MFVKKKSSYDIDFLAAAQLRRLFRAHGKRCYSRQESAVKEQT